MPTTYAHWAFGRKCIEQMPQNLQDIIHANRDIYNFGVHGPDILFYLLTDSKVTDYGYRMHNIPASEFFKKAKVAFKKHDEKDEMLTYIVAFLTHFTLDSQIHSYVERKIEESNISHNHIEAQWDRHVMLQDNRVPNLVDRSESLKPTKKIANIISYFFPQNKKTIYKSIKMQKFFVKLANAISPRKQSAWQKGLRLIKSYNNADLFIGFEEDRKCADSNLRMDKLENKAFKLFPKLLDNLLNYLNDKEELDEYFEHDFEVWPDYKHIPVLSYDEELAYEVK